MTNYAISVARSGQSDIPKETEQVYTLIITVLDRPGAVDRIVNALRRRRANMQTFVMGRAEAAATLRISVMVTDSEVGIDHLTEQIRKIVDVQQATHIPAQQAVIRELALIQVKSTVANFNEIIELGRRFGAYTVDITPETITLEVAGSVEQVESFLSQMHHYGVRDVARSGRVAIARGEANQ